jgi:predicted translin family RNA/ssDNA-binding protein
MVNIRKGKLARREKKVAVRDERQMKKEADELIRQTRRDMFNPARMTIRHIDQHQHEIDEQLSSLERLRGNVRAGHQEHSEIQTSKAELKSWKKRLRMARKAKKLGAKNEEVSSALKQGEKRHSHGPMKSLLGRLGK